MGGPGAVGGHTCLSPCSLGARTVTGQGGSAERGFPVPGGHLGLAVVPSPWGRPKSQAGLGISSTCIRPGPRGVTKSPGRGASTLMPPSRGAPTKTPHAS